MEYFEWQAIQGILDKATQMHLTQLVISRGDYNLSLSASANGGVTAAVTQKQIPASKPQQVKEAVSEAVAQWTMTPALQPLREKPSMP